MPKQTYSWQIRESVDDLLADLRQGRRRVLLPCSFSTFLSSSMSLADRSGGFEVRDIENSLSSCGGPKPSLV